MQLFIAIFRYAGRIRVAIDKQAALHKLNTRRPAPESRPVLILRPGQNVANEIEARASIRENTVYAYRRLDAITYGYLAS